MLEHEVLPDPEVSAAITQYFDPVVVDVDEHPRWMDLPGIEGLPVLAFFDAEGHHVLTRSGYRQRSDLVVLLTAVAHGLARGELEPYPDPPPPVPLSAFVPLDHQRAAAELERAELSLYVLVNSNDGGFSTPARHPYPAVLLELQRWLNRSPRAESWIEMTIERSLRGHSPRLDGEALTDFPHTTAELIEFATRGPALGPSWRDAVDGLPNHDPYRGLQDPVDKGVFRYAAGPGWYHPHFERRAMDNLAWALLLKARGRNRESQEIYNFVVTTFSRDQELAPLATSQRGDPFYARLRANERDAVPPPKVPPLLTLEVQARAAQLDPQRCALLERVDLGRWPRAHWSPTGEDPSSPEATVDSVGELLIALSACPGRAAEARALAELVLARWEDPGFEVDARLVRLAAGICHAFPAKCRQSLAAVEGLELDLRFAPPLAELASVSSSPW